MTKRVITYIPYGVVLSLLALYVLAIKMPVPETRNYESIRNIYFHVPMWFGMMILFSLGFWYSLRYLRTFDLTYDRLAYSFSSVGTLFGILGISTGMVWAAATWGSPWNNDPKQLGAAIALLGYFAYLILRKNLKNEVLKARVAAVYNVFAYFILFPTIWILPRLVESLHPGGLGDGEVTFDPNNLTTQMRLVMWLLAVPTWVAIGIWIAILEFKILSLKAQIINKL